MTLGIVAAIGCVLGIIGRTVGRNDIFNYAFFPGLVVVVVAVVWDRSRYRLMVVKVTGKRKQFVETVRSEDHNGNTHQRDVYEFWLSTNLGRALVRPGDSPAQWPVGPHVCDRQSGSPFSGPRLPSAG